MSALSVLFLGAFIFGSCYGNPTPAPQKFTYNTIWQGCFASKSAAYGYASRAECEERSNVQDLICYGPALSLREPPTPTPLPNGLTLPVMKPWRCHDTACPDTHNCVNGGLISQCCSKEYTKLKWEVIEAEKCPDGSKAGGERKGDKFWTHVGVSCDDLACGEGQKCVKINDLVSKCCGAK
ncbi:hypothetical protein QR680_007073 [Steinernema hermaphroditum]|uniref:WAP domain-containing protein n=1 Tax=Steinernema hermaphroditum TaxID=289476 RepID=A0AA39HXL9_9BILA|nr:hypothetical protein QR680_007073 [Steinernema hermaphroditum]